jgi:hypothetical protein
MGLVAATERPAKASVHAAARRVRNGRDNFIGRTLGGARARPIEKGGDAIRRGVDATNRRRKLMDGMSTGPVASKYFPICLGLAVVAAAALAYGLWNAKLDAEGPNKLIVPMQVDQLGEAQLFFDRGAGIREEDSDKVTIEPSDTLVELSFSIPRVPIREVRFDPFNGAGKFTLGQPRVETVSGRFVAKFPMTAIVARHQIAQLQQVDKMVVGATEPGANDPMLTFALGAPLRVGSPRIPWPEGVLLIVFGVMAWRTRPKTAAAA